MTRHACTRLLLTALVVACSVAACGQDAPYFLTYDHHLQDVGDLEFSLQTTVGLPDHGAPRYIAPLAEFEYGVRRWWTASLYLEAQSTPADSTVFTGWRFENRFRPLRGEHRINPVLYVEYENINEASRIQKEIVGHSEDGERPLNAALRREIARELEMRLILSRDVRAWNVSANFIFEKNLSSAEATEFGYALAASRRFRQSQVPDSCRVCLRNLIGGAELYGGLGSTERFGFADTAQYLAPTIGWHVAEDATLKFSPAIGISPGAERALIRFAYTYEIEGFGGTMKRLFRRSKPSTNPEPTGQNPTLTR
jgi:hypothetical protein